MLVAVALDLQYRVKLPVQRAFANEVEGLKQFCFGGGVVVGVAVERLDEAGDVRLCTAFYPCPRRWGCFLQIY